MYDQKIPKPAASDDREVGLDEWDDIVADRYKVPKNLFRAMTKQESGGDPNAVSPTGVRGRQQVTQRVAKSYGLNRDDPYHQSVAAARYLREQYDALGDIKDDDERWLGGLARYYGGGNAVDAKTGTLSGSSVDGLSNPGEHVERVAKKWGELNRGGGPVAAPTPAPSRTLAPKRTTRTVAPSPTAPQDSPFSLSAPTGFMAAEQGARSRTLSPEAQVEANLRNAEAQRYELRSAPGKASEMVKAGAMRGAQALGNMMRAAGTVTTGQTGGKPALAPETEARLQRQEAAQDVLTPNTAPVVRGVTSGAIQAVPIMASGGAGAAAPFIMGAASQASNEDWSQPGRALARTALGAVAPAAAGKAATALMRPATRAAQIATGAAGGAAGNVATSAADQAIFEGKLDPQALAQQAVTGAALGAVTPPPKYRARQPRGGKTADEVFPYDIEGNEIKPPITEAEAIARVPQKPFDPTLAAPEENLSPAEIRAKFNRQGRRVLQEKIAAQTPERQTVGLRKTQGIERSEPVLPDAPTEQLTAGATSRLPQVEAAPEAPPAPRANPIREAFRAEADAAKIEAAQLEQQGRFDEAAIKFEAAHRALTRLRRNIGNPKTEAEVGLLGQLDTEIAAAAQNRANARKGKGRVTAQEEPAVDTAPTRGITSPLLKQVANPEGGVPEIAPESVDFSRLAARQERGQDNRLANKSILARIRELGGIKPGIHSGELIGAKEKQYPGLINRRGGVDPDTIIQYLAEDGYPVDRNDLNTLWKAIDDDVAGGNVRPLDRVMNTEEVIGKGYSDFLRGQEGALEESASLRPELPEVLPAQRSQGGDRFARPTRRYSAMEQAKSELSPSEQLLLDRADQRPRPVAGRGLVSFSPFNDLVTNNRQAVDRLYGMDLNSPEAKPLLDQIDSYAQRRRIDPEHVENLKNYIRNEQISGAGMERRGVNPEETRQAESTANLRDFYSRPDELPADASGRLSQRLLPVKPRPAQELPYKGGTAPLDTTQPEKVPQLPGLREVAAGRFKEMPNQDLDAFIDRVQSDLNRDVGKPFMSADDRQAALADLMEAKSVRGERVNRKEIEPQSVRQQRSEWADTEWADEAEAFRQEFGRFPKDLREIRSGRPPTQAITKKIQHEKFGEVDVIEKTPQGRLRVRDSEGNFHIIKNPRTAGNQQATFIKKPLTEELSMPVAEQVGKLPESAVEPDFVTASRRRLQETATGKRANAGQALFDQAIVTGYQAYKAGMQFRDWSKEVIAKAGAAVEPHLRRAWAEIKKFHEDEGGAAKVSPGPSAPQSPTAKATRGLSDIKLETVGSGRLPRSRPRQQAAAPTPETMRRAGLRDITPESLRAPAGEVAPEAMAEAAPKGKLAKAAQVVGDLYHGPKSLLSSADLSAAGRQGLFLSLPPSQWGKAAKATGRQLSSLVSEKNYQGFVEKLRANPDYDAAQKSKLFLATDDPTSKGFTERDESFVSNLIGKLPHVKISERAYKTYLDSIRMDSFSKYKKLIESQPGTAEQKQKALEAAAEWINTSSGRGKIHGSAGEMVENATPLLNTIFFAPRYTISRFQMLNPATYARNLSDPQSRVVFKQQMSEMFQSAAVLATTGVLAKAAGADISFDPDDADFLKLKFGNTRFDVLGGVQGAARLAARIGEWAKAEGFEDDEKQLSARRGRTVDALKRFARGKLGPVPSFFVDWLNDWKGITGETHTPTEVSVKNPIASRVLPLLWNDIFEAWGRGYKESGAAGGVKGSAKFAPSVFGVGVQDYDRKAGAVGLESSSKLSQELRRQGGKFESISAKPGEPKEVHKARADRIEGWFSEYGEKLVSDPGYQSLSDDQKEAAVKALRQRIGAQANLTRPSERNFAPSQIIRGVRSAERERSRNRGKFIWTPPEE